MLEPQPEAPEKKIRLLNLSHDLALANNSPYYQPPKHVRQMELDLAGLTQYYTGEGVQVWGWNSQIRHKLKQMGVDKTLLPTEGEVEEYRQLASRRVACELLRDMKLTGLNVKIPLVGDATFYTTIDEVKEAVQKKEDTLLKAPISGSGRGLRFGECRIDSPLIGWCSNVIEEQGGVVAETFYHKKLDFAFEFNCDGAGNVEYCGFSVFKTTKQGKYLGNFVASQEQLMGLLAGYLSVTEIERLAERLTIELADIFWTGYCGPIGVDMMIVEKDWRPCLHPCVEINLRRTMGMLALQFESMVTPGKIGLFRIANLEAQDQETTYIELTPRGNRTEYQAQLLPNYL